MSVLDEIPPFRNHLPIRVQFGEGTLAGLVDVLDAEEASRPFVLVDPGVAKLPSVVSVLQEVSRVVGPATVRTADRGEPSFESAEEIGQELADASPDALIAIGGGSVMDTAKSARLALTQRVPLRRFLGGAVAAEAPAVSLVTVPTTAGTGSEVTGGAVLHDSETGSKVGIADPLLRAQHAIVDPELTHGLPAEPTMYGGIDALAQGISATVTTPHTPIGDAIGLEAARLAYAALPAVLADGSDRVARTQMACASLMAGLAMNISECGSEHWLAHPLGARFDLPHGLTVGLVLAESMDVDRAAVPERFERVASALGARDDGSRDGTRAVSAVRALLAEIGFPTLRSAGLDETDLPDLAEEAIAGWIPVSPREWTRQDALAAYEAALSTERRPAVTT